MNDNDKLKYNFHYDREERLTMPGASKKMYNSGKGFLKGNKSLKIIVLDLIIVVFILFIFNIFFRTVSGNIEVEGYVFIINAYPLKDKIIIRLRVRKSNENAYSGNVKIKFMLNDSELIINELLPDKINEEIDNEYPFYVKEHKDELKIEILINEKIKIISRKLDSK